MDLILIIFLKKFRENNILFMFVGSLNSICYKKEFQCKENKKRNVFIEKFFFQWLRHFFLVFFYFPVLDCFLIRYVVLERWGAS